MDWIKEGVICYGLFEVTNTGGDAGTARNSL